MIWLLILSLPVIGWFAHRSWMDGLMQAQEAAHKNQMETIFVEVKRLRAQVASLIGKE